MANGTNTTNTTLGSQYTYVITLKKLISSTSVTNIMVVKNTQAYLLAEMPSQVQQSTKPLTGSYRITCPDPVDNMLY